MADYVYKPSINIESLVQGLQNLKAEAVSAEKIMGMIGNRGNLNKLLDTFLRMDSLVSNLTKSSDALRASFGQKLRGGYLDNLDTQFGELSNTIKQTQDLAEKTLNVDLRKSGASGQLKNIATQINAMMDGYGMKDKIDLKLFDEKGLKEQRDELIKYINQIGSQITTSVGKIDVSNIGGEIADGFDDATKKVKNSGQKFSAEVQVQIDELQEQAKRLRKAQTDLNKKAELLENVKKNGASAIPNKFSSEITVDNMSQLLDEIDALKQKISSGTLSTEEYINSLLQLADATMKVQKAFSTIKGDDALTDMFKGTDSGARKNQKTLYDTLRFYSGGSSDNYNKVIQASSKEIANQALKDTSESIKALKQIDSLVSEKDLAKYTDPIEKSLREIDLLSQKLMDIDPDTQAYSVLEDKIESLKNKFKEMYDIKDDVLNQIDQDGKYGLDDLGVDEETTKSIVDNFKQIINASNQAPSSISQVGKIAVDATEYINNMALALQNLFNVGSRKPQLEYKVLINGQEIDMRPGADKSISSSTYVESYLANLDSNTLVDAHTHQGLSANIGADDFNNAAKRFKAGLAPLSAIVGQNYITTIDLTKVKLEDLAAVIEKVNAAAAKSTTKTFTPKKFNQILSEINPEYTDVVKEWDPSKFQQLAQYIFDVGESANISSTPLEKFKALLSAFNVDASKYEDLLQGFSKDNAQEIFNKIAQQENLRDENGSLIQAKNVSKSSIADASKNLEGQIGKYKQLREEANLTYSQIKDGIDKVLTDKDYSFIDKFYHPGELGKIQDYFVEVEDGLMNIDQMTAKMATDFGVNPSEFQQTTTAIEAAGTATQDASGKMEEFKQLSETSSGQLSLFDNVTNSAQEAGTEVEELVNDVKQLDGQISIFDQEKKLYENADGEFSLWEGAVEGAKKAEESINGVEDAIKEVKNLDEQISLFDDGYIQNIQSANDELKEHREVIEDIAKSDSNPADTNGVTDSSSGSYALESTLQQTNAILQSIDGNISKEESNKTTPITDFNLNDINSAVLKAASGLGSDVQLGGFETMENGLRKVSGAFKNANGVWEGFTAKVNETNQVVKISTKAQSAFAESLNKANTETKEATKNTKSSIPSIKAQEDKYAVRKNNVQNYLDPNSETFSSEVVNQVRLYEAALNDLKAAQQAFNNTDNLTADQLRDLQDTFAIAKDKCESYGKELDKLVKANEKFKSSHENVKDISSNDYDDAESALRDYVNTMYGANAKIEEFDSNLKQLNFTFKDSSGSIKQMTAAFDATGTAIGATINETKQSTSIFDSLLSDIKSKSKGLFTYFTARFGVDELFQQVRNGVQYVREIDLALTELKKVTNETDTTYDRFLQNASKTASVVGSTVSELTTMSAEWARLGYSIEDSAKLAESTAILLNVSEFTDATEASEALISTMQAFQYTADESQHVVDVLNEVKITCLLVW